LLATAYILLQGTHAIKNKENGQGQGRFYIANYARLQGKILPNLLLAFLVHHMSYKITIFLPNSAPKSYFKPRRLGATNQPNSLSQVSKSLAAARAT